MSRTATSLPDDPAALKVMILQLQATLRAHDLLVQSLRMRIARLKRQAFGKGSEKIAREIEQLEFALESLQVAEAEVAPPPEPESVETVSVSTAQDEQDDGEAQDKPPRRRPRRVARHAARAPRTGSRRELPGLRRRLAPGGRGRQPDPRHDHGAAEADRGGAAEEVLSVLREDGAVPGTDPPDPRQPRRSEPARLHSRRQVRRPPATLPPERDLCPDGCGHSRQHARGLVRWCHADPGAAGRVDPGRGAGL